MDIRESFKMAYRTLMSNRLRTSLTMLGIVIGNASVITMIGIGQGAQRLASNEFESLGPNTIFITPGSEEAQRTTFDLPKTLVLEDAEAIAKQVPSVEAVAPQITQQRVVTYQNKNSQIQTIGATPEFLGVRDFEVDKGRFITDQDLQRNARVLVLGSERADKFFGSRNPIGEDVRVGNISFEVVGVLEAKGAFLGTNQDDVVYVPLTTMANQLVGRTSPYGTEVTFISVSAKNEERISAAAFQITNLLRQRHQITGADDFSVQSQQDILDIVGRVTDGLTILLTAIAAISLLVGGIGVMNIMLVSVSERTQEIGLRKALGAKEGDILSQFLVEATIVSVIGGIVGIGIGVSGITVISLTTPLASSVSPMAVTLAVSVSGGIGLIFGVLPARRAAKLDPIVALRRL
ncbi:ABC transporter permease [Spirulina sp. CS-785/01]|uniref:ABC transporter permease n=1 Tax=Spirulina sp. CS-785/01 TaxID=3021716 RepID=UPI00232F8895|nr:ABC transporter permease [Spirulina sp. CS-785/01]MDB9315412.1 ABC transporter permease [Spirulina sp. CS-785/01]